MCSRSVAIKIRISRATTNPSSLEKYLIDIFLLRNDAYRQLIQSNHVSFEIGLLRDCRSCDRVDRLPAQPDDVELVGVRNTRDYMSRGT